MISATDTKNTFYILNKKEKTPIIFIHGVGLNHTIWSPQIDFFDNTVIAYDILGHGKTPLEKNNLSFNDFSIQLLNLIDELDIDKIHLVGFSIGSLIARDFATKYNSRLKSLTLLCSIFNRSAEQQRIVNDRFELSKKSESLSKQALKRWFTDEYLEKYPDTYQKITSILKSNNMQNFLKVYELFVKHKDQEIFDNIKVNEYPIYLRTKKFKIGMIPQNGGYFHDMTLIDNLKAIGEIQIDNQHDMNSKINQLISRF